MPTIGECPYEDCDHVSFVEMPEQTPCYCKAQCEGCGRSVWYYLSRVDPAAYTKEDMVDKWESTPELQEIIPKSEL